MRHFSLSLHSCYRLHEFVRQVFSLSLKRSAPFHGAIGGRDRRWCVRALGIYIPFRLVVRHGRRYRSLALEVVNGSEIFLFDCLPQNFPVRFFCVRLNKKYILHPYSWCFFDQSAHVSSSGRLSRGQESPYVIRLRTVETLYPVEEGGEEEGERKVGNEGLKKKRELGYQQSPSASWTRGQVEGRKPAAFLCYPQSWKKGPRDGRRENREKLKTRRKKKKKKKKDVKTKQKEER